MFKLKNLVRNTKKLDFFEVYAGSTPPPCCIPKECFPAPGSPGRRPARVALPNPDANSDILPDRIPRPAALLEGRPERVVRPPAALSA